MSAELPHFLSLGAGVQSSTIALMAAAGEITPMPKAAIFADTEAEPASVYKWLEWLERQLPFPVHRVTYVLSDKKRVISEIVPEFFVGVGRYAEIPDLEHFRVKKGLRMRTDIPYEGVDKVLGFAASRSDKYPVPRMNIFKDLLLPRELLRISALDCLDQPAVILRHHAIPRFLIKVYQIPAATPNEL